MRVKHGKPHLKLSKSTDTTVDGPPERDVSDFRTRFRHWENRVYDRVETWACKHEITAQLEGKKVFD